jgi:hypothetical protein
VSAVDPAVTLALVLPLAALHLALRRHTLAFQFLVDLLLAVFLGPVIVHGDWLASPAERAALGYGGGVPRSNVEQADLAVQFVPWGEEARRLLRSGEPPWISDRIGGGTPLYANSQSGVPFPLQLPVLPLGADRATLVMAGWKLELAALGAFLLLRRWRLLPAAAAVGAVAYAFGLYSLSWVDRPLGWSHAALPWAWLLVRWALRGRRPALAGAAVLLGTLVGWNVNAEVGALVWLSAGAWGFALAGRDVTRWRRAAVVFVLAVAVSAAGALPALVTIAGSAKYREGRERVLYPMPGIDLAVRAAAVARLVAPWRDGHPTRGPVDLPFPVATTSWSIGTAALVLLLAGAPQVWQRRLGRLLLGHGLAAALLVFQVPVAAAVLARVPLLGSMTWARAGFLLVWSLAGLAALAADALLRVGRTRPVVVAAMVIQVAALAALATGNRPLTAPAAVLAPLLLLLVWVIAPARRPLLVTALVAAEVALLGGEVLARSQPVDRMEPPPTVALLQRVVRREGGRMLGLGGAFPENLPALYGFADLRSNDPVRPLALARLHRALGATGMDLAGPVTTPWAGLAGAWGVRWLVTPPGGLSGPVAVGWREIYADAHARIYRNTRALDEVRLACAAIESPGDPATGSWEPVDFATTAIVAGPITASGGGRLEVVERRPAQTTVTVVAHGTVLAIRHAPRAPGWTATLDGQRVPLIEVNLGAMAVAVPDGEHEVRWRYQPPGLVVGAVLTLAGLLACGMLVFAGRRRARRW